MKTLAAIRAEKPFFYPDQSIYAEYACHAFGLKFSECDGGTGFVFTISSATATAPFGAGRCSFFPQNSATAATLASDKYFSNVLLDQSGIATLGGEYFFLHERYRAHRAPGHERTDAISRFGRLGNRAFIKPLTGSRGDFAQTVGNGDELMTYLDEVSRHYDAILMQQIYSGQEYRIFVLDEDIIYCAEKLPPAVTGDGRATVRQLIANEHRALDHRGISSAATGVKDHSLDHRLAEGERRVIPGRRNRSAGGSMSFAIPDNEAMAFDIARRAVKMLGLRVGAVDFFTNIDGDPAAMRVIEVNANPSIRFLEDSGRDDLILHIWRHTLTAIGLIDV